LAGLIVIGLLVNWGIGRYHSYQLSLTPTPTPTATATPTFTPTMTLTPTLVPTSTPTGTATETPRPLSAVAQRDVWARSGCYATYAAVGIIPAGGPVLFLQSERRFDDFNRECALVRYQRGGVDVIGWVLIADLGALPPPTPSPAP
jgi:hypothetical protein